MGEGILRLFALILIVSASSLFVFVAKAAEPVKSYDPLTKTVLIKNNLGNNLLEVQLISNTDQCLSECEAVLRIRPYAQLTLPSSPSAEFKWDFVKALPDQLDLKSYSFEKLVLYAVTDYSEICNPYESTTPNRTVTIANCTNSVTGSHTEYKYEPFNFWGEILEADRDHYIKLKGRKHARLGENNIEWVPTFHEMQIIEWAWWNGNWSNRRLLNVTDTQANDVLWINLSAIGVTCAVVNCSDIRVTNLTGDIEPYQVPLQNASTRKPNNFLVLPLTSGSKEFYIYYNNSAASAAGVNFTVWEDDFESYNIGAYPRTPNSTSWAFSRMYVLQSEGQKALGNTNGNNFDYAGMGKLLTNWTLAFELNGTVNAGFTGMETTTSGADGYRMNTDGNNIGIYDNTAGWVIQNCIVGGGDGKTPVNWTFTRNGTTLRTYVHNQTAEKSCGGNSASTTNFYYAKYDRENPNIMAAYRMAVYDNTAIGSIFAARTFRGFSNYTVGSEEIFNQIIADETSGRDAIVQGIVDSVIGPSAIIYTDQQIYIYNLTGNQTTGKFDKVASSVNQRWAFNYVTQGENSTNMKNLTPSLYIMEMQSLTTAQITEKVKALINSTKSG